MVYFDRPIANRLLGTYHFVCLDIIREEKAGQPEKQMNKQKHDSDRGRSLVFEISEKNANFFENVKSSSFFWSNFAGKILDEQAESENSNERKQKNGRQSEANINIFEQIKIRN